MPKILTADERAWLRPWCYAYETPGAKGVTAVALRMGYTTRNHLSLVLNDKAARKGIDDKPWMRLLTLLVEDGDAALFFEDEAASAETIRQLRTMRRRRRLVASLDRPAGDRSTEERKEAGRVEVTA